MLPSAAGGGGGGGGARAEEGGGGRRGRGGGGVGGGEGVGVWGGGGGKNQRYVLPDDITLTVFADKTTVAKFYNKLKPVTPDIPKTGDSTNIGLWAALCAVSPCRYRSHSLLWLPQEKRKLKKDLLIKVK